MLTRLRRIRPKTKAIPQPAARGRRIATRPAGSTARTAILDAARELCFHHGAAGVSARKIARAVGCSPTAIYLYYRSIDDLLHNLRMEGHGLLAEYLRSADPKLDAVARVQQMGRAYFRFGREHPNYYDLMFMYRFADMPPREAVQREMNTLLLLRDVVREGIERGEIRRDLDSWALTNGLWAEIHGVTSLAVSGLLYQTTDEGQHEDVLEAVLEGMARWLSPAGESGGLRRS